MKLILHVEGAASESLERGVAAAWRVFRWNAANPWETAVARFKREGSDVAGFPDDMKPSAREMKLAEQARSFERPLASGER